MHTLCVGTRPTALKQRPELEFRILGATIKSALTSCGTSLGCHCTCVRVCGGGGGDSRLSTSHIPYMRDVEANVTRS